MVTTQELINEDAQITISVKELDYWERLLRESWAACKDKIDMLDSDKIDIVADNIMNLIWKKRLEVNSRKYILTKVGNAYIGEYNINGDFITIGGYCIPRENIDKIITSEEFKSYNEGSLAR